MRVITLLICFLLNYYATAQFGKIQGYVLNSTDNEAIPFANVQIQGTEIGTMTNELGYFELNNLQSTIYNIKIWALGYNEMILSEIQVTNNKPVKLNIQLTESILNLQEILIQSNAFQKSEESPLSLRVISVTEINRNPGSNRDISKVVQSLPGVTSTAAFRNDLIIRGGAPNENRFYLDDVEVPNINHFATQGSSGGPVGMINVAFIREVEFLSSAFPANRGNALSSVFDFKQRDGRDDRMGFSGTLGASDIG
ncbi:MAG TPA: TonB-dependent receptor, partial [Saprospiraceae bacterium]|nr:TonB-dependent receptor [Saprospiraceae bacterium]